MHTAFGGSASAGDVPQCEASAGTSLMSWLASGAITGILLASSGWVSSDSLLGRTWRSKVAVKMVTTIKRAALMAAAMCISLVKASWAVASSATPSWPGRCSAAVVAPARVSRAA